MRPAKPGARRTAKRKRSATPGKARYAIMSDAHANPVALEAALADARAQGCEKFLFLGDVTGYGYDAKRALSVVRGGFDVVLLGNHDSACLGRETSTADLLNPNYDLDRAQHDMLTKTELRWLGSRPFTRTVGGMALVHGDFTCPEGWNYIFGRRDALANFASRPEALMFCGHTHHCAVWELSADGSVSCPSEGMARVPATEPETVEFRRAQGARYIVNVGSVGYPRNDLCATYAICDPSEGSFALRRLPFDFKSYIAEMLSRGIGLPRWLRDILLAVRD